MNIGALNTELWKKLIAGVTTIDEETISEIPLSFAPSSITSAVRAVDVRNPDSYIVVNKFDFDKLTHGRKFDIRSLLPTSASLTAEELFSFWKSLAIMEDLERGEVDFILTPQTLTVNMKPSCLKYAGSVEICYANA